MSAEDAHNDCAGHETEPRILTQVVVAKLSVELSHEVLGGHDGGKINLVERRGLIRDDSIRILLLSLVTVWTDFIRP